LETPNRITLLDAQGKAMKTLLDAPNPLQDYKLGQIKLFSLKNKEGIELNARMILPPDFDAHKKYPVIVYVYGGPHGQMITNSFLRGWPLWYQYMAERGYIIFTLDNRGTNNRGLAFEQAIYQHLGTKEVEDQMVGVNYLKKQSFVDSTRIGVHGWSYGGFMTISLMTRRPGVFKVAVAGGPVIDWRYYEVMYGERYMDTPQKNPEGYEEASLLNYVKNLQGKLLIIHGTVDPVVVWQNSLLYLRKAIDLQKQVDYFVYPGDEHNMHGKDRVHLYQKITDYFMENL
jgi:dipeptidyl-peptidase-4